MESPPLHVSHRLGWGVTQCAPPPFPPPSLSLSRRLADWKEKGDKTRKPEAKHLAELAGQSESNKK